MPDVLGQLVGLGRTALDRALLDRALGELDAQHRLASKIAAEPNLAAIMTEFVTRLMDAFGSLSAIRGQAVLDIACGSSSSRSPVTGRQTSEFEPWMCRLLVSAGRTRSGSISETSPTRRSSIIGSTWVSSAPSTSWQLDRSMPSMRAGSLAHSSFVPRTGTPPNGFVARSTARRAACCGQAGFSSTATVGLALARPEHRGGQSAQGRIERRTRDKRRGGNGVRSGGRAGAGGREWGGYSAPLVKI